MAETGRPRGSRNPDRLRDSFLDELVSQLPQLSDEQLVVGARLLQDQLSRRRDYRHAHTGTRRRYTNEAVLAALCGADAEMFVATGERMTKVDDYRRHKAEDAPSVRVIYDRFGSFEEGLLRAGLLDEPAPEVELVIRDGRPPGGGTTWTFEMRVQALALGRELCFTGRRCSRNAFDLYIRRRISADLPNSNQITGKSSKSTASHSWDEMHAAAEALALENPDAYPLTAAYAARAAGQAGEAT